MVWLWLYSNALAFRLLLGIRCGYCLMLISPHACDTRYNPKMLLYPEFHLTFKFVRHGNQITS